MGENVNIEENLSINFFTMIEKNELCLILAPEGKCFKNPGSDPRISTCAEVQIVLLLWFWLAKGCDESIRTEKRGM